MYQITYEIPIPKGPREGAPVKWPFEEMDVGGSFLVAFKQGVSLRQAATRWQAKLSKTTGAKFTIRQREIENGDGEDGYRCWRVE